MASDGQTLQRSFLSEFIIITEKLKHSSKLSIQEMELNQVLDKFLGVLNEKEQFLRHGILNLDFPEAGLFLQNSTAILAKEIDSLWTENLEFHIRLCTIDVSSVENQEQTVKVMERINQRKRKKIVIEDTDTSSRLHQNIIAMVGNIAEFEKKYSQVHYFADLQDLWKDTTREEEVCKEAGSNFEGMSGFQVPLNIRIYDVQTKEKLCKYEDLNSSACCFSVTSDLKCWVGENDVNGGKITVSSRDDVLLQGYLKKTSLKYSAFCTRKRKPAFDSFKEKFRDVDLDNAFEFNAPSPWSESSVCEFNNNTMDSTSKTDLSRTFEGPRANSVCISEADSAMHDVTIELSDDEQPPSAIHSTRRSMADSGIFCESMEISQVDEAIVSCSVPCDGFRGFTTECICNSNNIVCLVKDKNFNKMMNLLVYLERFLKKIKRENKESNKRKAADPETPEEVKKTKRIRLKNIKTTVTSLKKFETFFRKNYQLEAGEAKDNCLSGYEDSDADNQLYPLDPLESAGTLSQLRGSDAEQTIVHTYNKVQELHQSVAVTPDNCNLTALPLSSVLECDESSRGTGILNESSCDVNDNVFLENLPSTSQEFSQTSSSEAECRKRVKAVSEWKQFIEPKLNSLESNMQFDIHEYGTHVMDSVAKHKTIPFKEMMKGKESWEVTRYFMATLQLANTYNIELINEGESNKIANETLNVKFLTRERYHEHLEEYEAPSEHEFREKLARVQALAPSIPVHSTPSTSRHVECRAVTQRRQLQL